MEQLKSDVVSILSVLAEETDLIPRSALYLALDSDIRRFEKVEYFLVHAGMIETTRDTVVLTARGRQAGETINRELAKGKEA